MLHLVQRCLRDGDDGAWVELWQVFEDVSAGEVRRILAEHGVPPEDADAVITRFWKELAGSGASGSGSSGADASGSGSFFGGGRDFAGDAAPPKNVPDPFAASNRGSSLSAGRTAGQCNGLGREAAGGDAIHW